MKVTTLLFSLICFASSYGQVRTANEEIPTISLEEAGFNKDSIESLIEEISNTHQRNFRGFLILKGNQVVIE